MKPTLKIGFSTGSPCAGSNSCDSVPECGTDVNRGFMMQNAKQSINTKSAMVTTGRAVVGQSGDLNGTNNRTNEVPIGRLGRRRDHRGGLPFTNSAQSFSCPLYRCKEIGVSTGEYRSPSTSPSSGPRSR